LYNHLGSWEFSVTTISIESKSLFFLIFIILDLYYSCSLLSTIYFYVLLHLFNLFVYNEHE